MSGFNLRRQVLLIGCLCSTIRAVGAVGYFKCTNNVHLFQKTECAQGCVTTEWHLESKEITNMGTSKATATDTFNDIVSSTKAAIRVAENGTTLLESLEISTSLDGLSVIATQRATETTQPNEEISFGSTGIDQKATTLQTVYKAQGDQTTEQLKVPTGVSDIKTDTEETFTSTFHESTENNGITTQKLASTKLVTTRNKVNTKQTSTSEKLKSTAMSTTKEPLDTTKGLETTEHTSNPVTKTTDHTTTEVEKSSKETTTVEGNVTINTTPTSELSSITRNTNNVTESTTLISTMRQETSPREILSTENSSTDEQTTALSFNNMATQDRTTHFTTALSITSPSCPTNMVYMNCTCQSTCEDPSRVNGCYSNCIAGGKTCICPEGFYLNGEHCVPPEECGCYLESEGVIIKEGDTQLFAVCTSQCSCFNGSLRCNEFQCDSTTTCVNEGNILQCRCKDGYHRDGIFCRRLTDCKDVRDGGLGEIGVYRILPFNWNGSAFEVYCQYGWTVFQRRQDGSVDFFRFWTDYKEGFGNLNGEMWLGLEKLHALTNQRLYKLKISLVSDNISYELNYQLFQIDSEENNYALKELGSYSGNIGSDPMAAHYSYSFSTRDRDNDNHPSVDCAAYAHGGWWYKQCYWINLNGPYGSPVKPGICYIDNSVEHCNIPFTEMSILSY